MAAPPRIALLVHNRFEDDPRVSRHARAIREAGMRAAVLSVGAPAGPGGWRWGALSDGAEVFESTARPTLLGRLRRLVQQAQARQPSAGATAEISPTVPLWEGGSRQRVGVIEIGRDLWRFAQLLRGNLAVARQFRPIGARVVHANDLNVLAAGYLLARAWKAPLLYDSHELWTALDADWSPFFRRLLGRLEGILIRRAAAVVTVNGAIADELATRYGVERPVVVMNCPEAPPESGERRAPDFPSPLPLRVIYQGMLNPHRGLVELVDAVARTPGVTLALRGPGVLRASLEARIDELGAGERVCLLPPVPMAELVASLDGFAVGVVPYLPVGRNNQLCSPNKLFEYLCAGLAVVCSDLPVLREIVTEADCGLLVAPGDCEAMAQALCRLATEPDLLATFRRNAWRAARERYNARHEEGKLLALYERLVGGKPDGTKPGRQGKDRP